MHVLNCMIFRNIGKMDLDIWRYCKVILQRAVDLYLRKFYLLSPPTLDFLRYITSSSSESCLTRILFYLLWKLQHGCPEYFLLCFVFLESQTFHCAISLSLVSVFSAEVSWLLYQVRPGVLSCINIDSLQLWPFVLWSWWISQAWLGQ